MPRKYYINEKEAINLSLILEELKLKGKLNYDETYLFKDSETALLFTKRLDAINIKYKIDKSSVKIKVRRNDK